MDKAVKRSLKEYFDTTYGITHCQRWDYQPPFKANPYCSKETKKVVKDKPMPWPERPFS